MAYSITWAQGIVSNWWVLCTRAQHFTIHYENTIRILPKEYWLMAGENLLQDLIVTVAYSKTDKRARDAWATIKACNKRRNLPLRAQEDRLTVAYIQIRTFALRFKRTGYLTLIQPTLF